MPQREGHSVASDCIRSSAVPRRDPWKTTAGSARCSATRLATLAYRGGQGAAGRARGLRRLQGGSTTRTPGGGPRPHRRPPRLGARPCPGKERVAPEAAGSWDEDVRRFHAGLAAFDAYLASDAPLAVAGRGLFQGPVADSINHVGQINMLRRMDGSPVKGENYFRAEIARRVGPARRAEAATPRIRVDAVPRAERLTACLADGVLASAPWAGPLDGPVADSKVSPPGDDSHRYRNESEDSKSTSLPPGSPLAAIGLAWLTPPPPSPRRDPTRRRSS